MRTSYGVVWQENGKPRAVGRLELGPTALQLTGTRDGEAVSDSFPYKRLAGVRIGRGADERLDGRPVLVLANGDGAEIRLAAAAQSMVLAELAEQIAAFTLASEDGQVVVVVPIKEGSRDAVRSLVDAGPPFEPKDTGLDRHEVFMTPREVVFVFESRASARALEELLTEPQLWQRASEWREHLAGPPRLAEALYSWERGTRSAGGHHVFACAHDDDADS